MKAILIRPAYSNVYSGIYGKIPKNRAINPPLGLMYIASVLENKGVEVKIIDGEPDLLSIDAVVEKTLNENPDFVGVTSTTPEFHIASEMLQKIKAKKPRIKTIAGGAHVSSMPEETLEENPHIDYIVVGEGERSILKIVDGSEERILSSPLLENLDEIRPARHLIDFNNYKFAIPKEGLVRSDVVQSSRGCPYRCNFCFHCFGKTVRFRDPISVIDEIEESVKKYGTRLMWWFDDTFTLKRDRTVTMCEEILKRDLNIHFYCFTRANTLDKDLLKLMKRAGFIKITLGVETGNAEMMKSINKGAKLEHYEKAYQYMVELGIETRGSFIVGHPYETRETIQDTMNFAKKLPLHRIGVNILTPYPGTKVYENAINGEGLHLLCKDWKEFKRWGNSVVETDSLSKEDLMYYQKKFLREFSTQPKILWYHVKELLKGNWSYFYYRPILGAIKGRIKYGLKELIKPYKPVSPQYKREKIELNT